MAETFGKTDKGGTKYGASPGRAIGCKYTSGSAGSLVSISTYVLELTGGDKVKCAIYDASFDKLANGETEELSIGLGQDGWLTFDFGTPPSVEATTVYWLVVWPNTSIDLYCADGTTNQEGHKDYAYGAWPDPIAFQYWNALAFSIFATYYEEPPSAAKTLVQAALISIPPLIVLPTLGQILRLTGGC